MIPCLHNYTCNAATRWSDRSQCEFVHRDEQPVHSRPGSSPSVDALAPALDSNSAAEPPTAEDDERSTWPLCAALEHMRALVSTELDPPQAAGAVGAKSAVRASFDSISTSCKQHSVCVAILWCPVAAVLTTEQRPPGCGRCMRGRTIRSALDERTCSSRRRRDSRSDCSCAASDRRSCSTALRLRSSCSDDQSIMDAYLPVRQKLDTQWHQPQLRTFSASDCCFAAFRSAISHRHSASSFSCVTRSKSADSRCSSSFTLEYMRCCSSMLQQSIRWPHPSVGARQHYSGIERSSASAHDVSGAYRSR